MDKIGDTQFRVMCEMWGVERAILVANNMGYEPTEKQINAGKKKEQDIKERFDKAFNKK